jgi:predicted HTH transcriptional regulator
MMMKSEATTRGIIGVLVRENMIEQRVEGKVHVYFLGKAYHQELGEEVAYTKMVGLSHARKINMIQEHLDQHHKISCGQIMELCDVERAEAKKLISEVREKTKLRLIGRGRGAHYEMEDNGN